MASSYHLAALPDGAPGTAATVAIMAQLAAGAHGAQSPAIRDLAVSIVAGVPGMDFAGELAAVLGWVRSHCTYRLDPVDLERVQTPAVSLEQRAGDCDDLAVLVAALVGALGHPSRFVTGGMMRGAWSHVWLEADAGGRWLALDACDPDRNPAGWSAPFPAVMRWPINAVDGFDPTAALDAATAAGLASPGIPMTYALQASPHLAGWFDGIGDTVSNWFKADEFSAWSTDPALGPLPDPQAWQDFNNGNPPIAGEGVPNWSKATPEQRSAFIKAFRPIQEGQAAKDQAWSDNVATVERVVEGVATLGISEVMRAWNNLEADAKRYGRERAAALAKADRMQAAGRTTDAAAMRAAVAKGDAAVRDKMGPLEPWLKESAGLGFLPTIIGGMAAPVALALIAAVAAAIAFALAEVAAVFNAISEATGGMPWLFIVAAGGAYWYWKRKKPGGAVSRNPGCACRKRRRARR